MRDRRAVTLVAPLLGSAVLLLPLTACGNDDVADHSTLRVVATFYPLQYVAEQVGGDRVSVTNLTPVGAEPHDLELSPQDVATLADADLVAFLSGFQPAVDEALAQAPPAHTVDAADQARLDLTAEEADHDDHDDSGEHPDEAATDPHFWLDPTRLADVADAVAAELAELDPAGADTYSAGASALRASLEQLDDDFAAALADCTSRDLVVSHAAFGYLADRYDLVQFGISGLTPETEPSPGDLAAATEFVREHRVQTIYFETLVSPAVAETIAAETGASTAVLDPLEGLTVEDDGDDYDSVMRANLDALVQGQGCA